MVWRLQGHGKHKRWSGEGRDAWTSITTSAGVARPTNGEVFVPLRDIDYFKRFSIKFNTIEWENGADFAPEYLYEQGVAEC